MRYGWRAQIGHISPAILDTSGEEMRKLLPDAAGTLNRLVHSVAVILPFR